MRIHPNLFRRRRLALVSLGLATLFAVPAAADAATTFGTDLSGPLSPVATPSTCEYNPAESCTRVPVYYSQPSHLGNVPGAPISGTIKKIRLVSATPGHLKVQLAKTLGSDPINFQAKIKHESSRIDYAGTGAIETFKVNLPVHAGEMLAVKAGALGAVQCDPNDYDHEAQFQPGLPLGGPFSLANEAAPCQALIQAAIR